MAELSKENKERIENLQLLEQNLSTLVAQKQKFQSQVLETESAITELDFSEKAYKIIGNIMVETAKDKLSESLNEKKEILGLRLKAIEKQENNIRKKASDLQKEVLTNMEK